MVASQAEQSSNVLSQAQRCASDGRWDDAVQLYQAVLAESPQQADAMEGLGLAALHGDRAAEGLEWLLRARQLDPDNARIITHLGIAQRRNGRSSEACATFRQAVALDPRAATLLNLARAEREVGRLAEAIQTFRRALQLEPDSAAAWSMLSNAMREAGNFADAAGAAREALTRDPWLGQGHINLGVALHRLGQLPDAVVSYWVATTFPSSQSGATSNLRVALADARLEEAASMPALRLVRRLLEAPTDTVALLGLGQLQLEQKQFARAIVCFERAGELAPKAALYHELGMLLWGLGYTEQAQARFLAAFACDDVDSEAYTRLAAWVRLQPHFSLTSPDWQPILERCPDDIFCLVNLGVALQRQDRPSQAIPLHERASRLEPKRIEAYVNWGAALCARGGFAEANATYRQALELDPTHWGIVSNLLFSLHFDPSMSPDSIFAEHVRFGKLFGDPLGGRRACSNSRDPARRLRIGYVSPDFRSHPVAHFLEPVLAQHDAGVVEVFCYSDVERPDAVTARLAGSAHHFIACAGWSDARLAEQIVADQIDILVDLTGHTGHNRLLVFARKPSPVQASWLGYFDTTGLTAIDYRIADAHSVPQAAEPFFVERVLRLPRSSNCFLPVESPEPVEPPCERRGHLTFGCFNNPAKVTREVVATFGRILREVPASRLILKYGLFEDPVLAARYREWLVEEGIPEDRVELWGHSSLAHFLGSFSQIDIALDPFPYSGETTALHTLWMGVPLVALEGPTLVQRLASRVLRVAGLAEWVASSKDDYVRIAVSLANDRALLRRCRTGLRDQLRASPLLDHRGVTRELEQAYREMWRTYCASDVAAATTPSPGSV